MSTELVTKSDAALIVRANALPPDMAALIERVLTDPTADVSKLDALIKLNERVMDRAAEAEFHAAFVPMQAQLQTVRELSRTDKTSYAAREDIVDIARPVLAEHGFGLSFRTEWPSARTVKVVGILTHTAGFSRTSEFLAEADATGSKNAIQALGSAVEYGRRYTTVDLLNIVTRKADDDGERTGHASAPEGFALWWDDLSSTADEGSAALEAAWKQSPKAIKEYTLNKRKSEWSALKSKAAKVHA